MAGLAGQTPGLLGGQDVADRADGIVYVAALVLWAALTELVVAVAGHQLRVVGEPAEEGERGKGKRRREGRRRVYSVHFNVIM